MTIHCLRIMCNDQINMIIIYRAREFCIVLALFGKTDSFEVAVLLQGLESKHVFLSPSCCMSVGLSFSFPLWLLLEFFVLTAVLVPF